MSSRHIQVGEKAQLLQRNNDIAILHLRIVKVILIVTERVVHFDGNQLQSHKAVGQEEYFKTVCKERAVVAQHNKRDGKNVQEEESSDREKSKTQKFETTTQNGTGQTNAHDTARQHDNITK